MTNLQTQIIKINSTIKTLQDVCLCNNKRPELVTTVEESEIICRYCGVVFGFDEENNINTVPYQHITKSKINLYQRRQTGGNPHDVKKIIHISNLRLEKNNDNSDLISFADICDKIKLSDITSENCWKSYCTLKKQTSEFTRAKAMCLAIYQTCRNNCIPFDEDKIRDIVCQSLGVKKAPMLKSIIFKTGQEKYRTESNNRETFYLNLHLSQAQKYYDIEDITTLRRIATRYYETSTNPSSFLSLKNNRLSLVMRNNNNNSDFNILAKRAVTLAIQRCIRQ